MRFYAEPNRAKSNAKMPPKLFGTVDWSNGRSVDRSACAQPFNHRLCGGLANEIENTSENP